MRLRIDILNELRQSAIQFTTAKPSIHARSAIHDDEVINSRAKRKKMVWLRLRARELRLTARELTLRVVNCACGA